MPQKTQLLKAAVVLVMACLMLYLGSAHGERLSPMMLHLEATVAASFFTTWSLFVLAFVLMALVALPVGALLSMGAGLLFGVWWGGLAGWLSTSIAAWLSFVGLRWWLGENATLEDLNNGPSFVRHRLTHLLTHRLDHHSAELLMVLRIVPLVPFYLINVAAALSPMSTWRYVLASIIGLMPSTFLYAMVGHGLGSWVEAKTAWEQGEVLTGSLFGVLGALGALAVLSAWGAKRLHRLQSKKDWAEKASKGPQDDGTL